MSQPPPSLPDELRRACETLRTRAHLLQLTPEPIDPDEWVALPAPCRGQLAGWIVDLHATFALRGLTLATTRWDLNYVMPCEFHTPTTLAPLAETPRFRKLLEQCF